MTKRQWKIIGYGVLIIGLSYALMKFLVAQKPTLAKRPPRVTERWVKAEPANYGHIQASVTGKGRVISTAAVEIVAEAAGKIEPGNIPLKTGQNFRKGQVLLTIYRDEAELALQAQKSRFQSTVATLLPDIKIDFPDEFPAFETFFQQLNLNTTLPAMPETADIKMKVFLASRNVIADYLAVKQAELKLERHTITAPFNGVYTDVYMEIGAYSNTGGRIGRIIATDALEVEIPLESRNARWVKKRDAVKLSSTERDSHWNGTVQRMASFINPETQSRSVFVKVPLKGSKQLYAGEYLNATFEGEQVDAVMKIPRNALFNSDEIFIIEEGLLKIATVTVAKLNQNTALIRGIQPGVFIVTQPMINVAENTPVKILGIDSPDKEKESGTKTTAQ